MIIVMVLILRLCNAACMIHPQQQEWGAFVYFVPHSRHAITKRARQTTTTQRTSITKRNRSSAMKQSNHAMMELMRKRKTMIETMTVIGRESSGWWKMRSLLWLGARVAHKRVSARFTHRGL